MFCGEALHGKDPSGDDVAKRVYRDRVSTPWTLPDLGEFNRYSEDLATHCFVIPRNSNDVSAGPEFRQDISYFDRYGNDDSSKSRGEIGRIDSAVRINLSQTPRA
jgi:hypothetical protein